MTVYITLYGKIMMENKVFRTGFKRQLNIQS